MRVRRCLHCSRYTVELMGIEGRGRSVAQAQNTASSAPGETGRKDYDYTTDKHFLIEEELGENCYFR
jgi:hypothetical protein